MISQQLVVSNEFFTCTKLVEFYFGSSVKRNTNFFHPYCFIIPFSVRERYFIIHRKTMIARVVDVILRRSLIIQEGLEIEVEVATAANEENIFV